MNHERKEPELRLKTNSLFSWLLEKCREYGYVIGACLIVGLLCYGFIFTNKLLNHDELSNLFGLGARVSSGRWGLEILAGIFPLYSLPWLDGILTLLLMTASVCLIIRIFDLRQPILQVLVSGLIIAFPSLTGTFTYMFTSVCYGISFFLSVFSVYLITCKKPVYSVLAVFLFAFSVGIYQAYMAVAASLLVIYLIQKTMYSEMPISRIFLKGVFFVGFLLISLGLYWGISQVFLKNAGEILNEYAAETMIDSRSIPDRIKDCIFFFIYVFTRRLRAVITPEFSQILHLLCGGMLVLEGIFWCFSKKHMKRLPLLLLLMLFYPLAVTSVLLIVELPAVHTLVIYSFATIYVLAGVILEGGYRQLFQKENLNKLRAFLMDAVLLCMSLVICSNIFLANQAYLELYINNSRGRAFAASLIAQIEMIPEFKEDMPVILSGEYPKEAPREFEKLKGLMGARGFTTKTYSYGSFLDIYIGTHLNLASEEELNKIKDSQEFISMPTYPNHGFLKVIDGSVVVKLPE